MGLAIIAALLFGIGSNPAIAQNVEIAWTDSFIDATDPGIKLLLRGKMAAGNSKFTVAIAACLIFVLDRIQSLDHAPESSLEPDNYSRTTIRHSNKPRPWCRRTRERCRRNRHNRSCSCPILFRWPAESGHAS